VAVEMTGSVGPQMRSSTYFSIVACGYCHSDKSWVRLNPKEMGAVSESLGEDSPGDLASL
jgi:hypothetical protein